jgi:hypothetical protein
MKKFNCQFGDGYETDSSQPGYNTYFVAAITAFVEHAQVVLTILSVQHGVSSVIMGPRPGDCSISGRPKLIGVDILH